MIKIRKLRWSLLAAIGNSPVSKIAIFMPFFGYIVLLQDRTISYTRILTDSIEYQNSTISLSLYFLYFGSFLFGTAAFLFHVFCPDVIKRFSNGDLYVERLAPLTTTWDTKSRLRSIIELQSSDTEAIDNSNKFLSTISNGISPSNEIIIFSLRCHYETLDLSKNIIQYFVFLFYFFGISCVSIPSLFTFYKVCKSLTW